MILDGMADAGLSPVLHAEGIGDELVYVLSESLAEALQDNVALQLSEKRLLAFQPRDNGFVGVVISPVGLVARKRRKFACRRESTTEPFQKFSKIRLLIRSRGWCLNSKLTQHLSCGETDIFRTVGKVGDRHARSR
ncbi:MAG: hypothetical protein AB7L71_18370 [Vicinamibacterales bacterium]